jgi:arginyl-tRNA--protein-N-Asp/Glu arginylyltransferase
MTIHDDHTPVGFNIIRTQLEKYLFEITAPCPYGLPHTAVFRQAMIDSISEPVLELLLADGYRRNGDIIYTMACRDCNECVPLRIDPLLFTPSRNQKRVIKKNREIKTTAGLPRITEEKLDMCNRFLRVRYPGKHNSAEEYYAGFFLNSGFCTYEIEYRLAEKLVGVAIVDCGKNFINAVYFYFDPLKSKRSPGTYNILHLIDFCRQKDIAYLYLGYWIEDVAAMRYKANFKPHYLLRDKVWTKVDNDSAAPNKETDPA